MLTNRDLRETMTVEEAAMVLGIGRSAAYAAAHSGEIPTIRIGRRLLVPRERLAEMLHVPQRTAA